MTKPVDEITTSYSEISTWRRCQYQHWLAYRHRYTPLQVKPALERGIGWDHILNLHYEGLQAAQREGAKPIDRLDHPAFKMFARRIEAELQDDPDALESQRELKDLLRWMYAGYVERWGPDAKWEILEVQKRMVAPLTTIETPDRILQINLKVYIDLLVREQGRGSRGRVWVVDAKSTTALGRRDLGFNDQSGLYQWMVANHGLLDVPIFGAIFSYALARKNKVKHQPLAERFKREPYGATDRELDEIANDAIESAWQANSRNLDWQPPRSPDDEMCRRRCDFLDACLAHRKGHDLAKFLRRTDHEVPEWHTPRLEGIDQFS